jgi:transcriptional regulator with XRE-family HTH domain
MPSRKPDRGPEPNTFGWRLREARLATGLPARKIAKKLRVAVSTYYSWEGNAKTPRNVVRLATVVRSTVGALYGERAA